MNSESGKAMTDTQSKRREERDAMVRKMLDEFPAAMLARGEGGIYRLDTGVRFDELEQAVWDSLVDARLSLEEKEKDNKTLDAARTQMEKGFVRQLGEIAALKKSLSEMEEKEKELVALSAAELSYRTQFYDSQIALSSMKEKREKELLALVTFTLSRYGFDNIDPKMALAAFLKELEGK